MAIVIGPLHSLTASGDVGKQLTYRRVLGNNVVSEYAAPTDTRTRAQVAHRSGMTDARAAWRALTPEEQEIWNNDAENMPGISGYNLFVKCYLIDYYNNIKPKFNNHKFNERMYC